MGTQLAVTVVVVVVLDSAVVFADIEPAITAAIEALFADLDVGETLLYFDVVNAIIDVAGVQGIEMIAGQPSLTLDGTRADVAPLSTELIVLDGDPAVSV